ncbi:Decarboxylase orsB [Lachnellula suecica]|uniref:Decarboxylase orsB n=1 Tax=Lachnellula suecica TaxID=602035 RepID=A0A8T9CF61_9HELO|nr:Decarboxylase orsB [Lachnellula suecica]
MTSFITLEEHFVSSKIAASGKYDKYGFPKAILSKMADLGEGRIKDMDAGSVALQVLSHAPLDASPSECTEVNDELALEISKNPDRLAGFALLPMENPKAAAEELSRVVTKYGFLGALIDNHLDGKFYDGEEFLPVFDKAQELDVPLYIHPTFASESMLEHYKGNYDDQIAGHMSAFGWGWHVETGLHILRLYASGLFDRFPKLKIVIGHMGELLPFQLARTSRITQVWGKKRSFTDVWKQNIWITTSGMFSLPPLACLLQTTTIDHVLYSVDYPFSQNDKGKDFVEEIKKSGLMSEEDMEKFAYRNAEVLLKVKAKSLK